MKQIKAFWNEFSQWLILAVVTAGIIAGVKAVFWLFDWLMERGLTGWWLLPVAMLVVGLVCATWVGLTAKRRAEEQRCLQILQGFNQEHGAGFSLGYDATFAPDMSVSHEFASNGEGK